VTVTPVQFADLLPQLREFDLGKNKYRVAGLYLDPPEAAAVFAFDEKTRVQAIDRTQPSLPMVPGRNRDPAGTCTSPPPRHRGSTSSNPGSQR